jgi:hypothetical protein
LERSATVVKSGGGPGIGSLEDALVVVAILVTVAAVWFWKLAD